MMRVGGGSQYSQFSETSLRRVDDDFGDEEADQESFINQKMKGRSGTDQRANLNEFGSTVEADDNILQSREQIETVNINVD